MESIRDLIKYSGFLGGSGSGSDDNSNSGSSGGVSDYNDLQNKPLLPLPVISNHIYFDLDVKDLEEGKFYYFAGTEDEFRMLRVLIERSDGTKNIFYQTREGSIPSTAYGLSPTFDELWSIQYRTTTATLDAKGRELHVYAGNLHMNITLCDENGKTDADESVAEETLRYFSRVLFSPRRYYGISNEVFFTPTKDANLANKGYVDKSIAAITGTVPSMVSEALADYDFPKGNWSVNDTSSAEYIKGRTHWEEPDLENSTDTLTWDGNMGGKLVVPYEEAYFVKLSDFVLSEDDLTGGSITLFGFTLEPVTVPIGEESAVTVVSLDHMLPGAIGVVMGNMPLVVIVTAGVDMGGGFIVEAGTYFASLDGGAVYPQSLTCTSAVFGPKIVHPMPEKFIPELSQVILKSTTNGSSKRFKLTVDDSGTITTTEIVE